MNLLFLPLVVVFGVVVAIVLFVVVGLLMDLVPSPDPEGESPQNASGTISTTRWRLSLPKRSGPPNSPPGQSN